MDDYFNKNVVGSFQRRKPFNEFAFHQMQSKNPVGWLPEKQFQQYVPRKYRDRYRLQQVYNNMIEQQMNNKFVKIAQPEYYQRLSPRYQRQESPQSEKRQALQQQIQDFNHSRVMNPQHSQPTLQRNHSIVMPQSYPYHEDDISNKSGYHFNSEAQLSPRIQKQYPRSPHVYRNYPQIIDKDSIAYPFRNAMPDQLQSFLRGRSKMDHTPSIKYSQHRKPDRVQ